MGVTSSKQGRYVVNPAPGHTNQHANPETPFKPKRYAPIISPYARNLRDTEAWGDHPPCTVTPDRRTDSSVELDESSPRGDFYTPNGTKSTSLIESNIDSNFYTPSAHDVTETPQQCTVCKDVRQKKIPPVKPPRYDKGEIFVLECNANQVKNNNRGGFIDNVPVYANAKQVTSNFDNVEHGNSPHRNNNADNANVDQSHTSHVKSHHKDDTSIGHTSPINPPRYSNDAVYASINPHVSQSAETLHCTFPLDSIKEHHAKKPVLYSYHKNDHVIQQHEQGKTVTHFLPYSTSTPLQEQGGKRSRRFVPYSTSTPQKQFQIESNQPMLPQATPDHQIQVPSSDSNKAPGKFTILEALFLLGSMVMYIVDIVMDILVALQYFRSDQLWYSGLTMAFVIIPSLTLQYFSLRWHYTDSFGRPQKENQDGKTLSKRVKVKFGTILTWIITHVLQLGALNRYWRTLRFGWNSRSGDDKARTDYNRMVHEYRDATMLRLLEAFMESAPQLVLQLYIMTQLADIHWLTAASALSSLASLSWCLEAYHKALRESDPKSNNIGWIGLGIRMMAQTLLITTRVVSLALFAAYFSWWVFVVAGVHWFLMTTWLICQKTEFCASRCEEVMFDAIIGIVHIFCFFNMKEGRTRYRALGYYTLVFVENTVMFGLWYMFIGKDTVYGLPALVFVWGGFFIGIAIMLFYYRFCHPDGPIPISSCFQCNTNTDLPDGAAEQTYPSTDVFTTIDGTAPSQFPKGHKKKNKKVDGNLFSRSGRRHLYWEHSIHRVVDIPRTQPISQEDMVHRTEEGHAFLETSLV